MAHQTTLPRTRFSQTRLVASLQHMLQVWVFRRSSRLSLGRLDAHALRDIGLDPLTAQAECAKPFWRD